MGALGPQIGNTNLDQLITAINLGFNKKNENEIEIYPRISLVDTTKTAEIAQYPMQVVSVKEKKKGFIEDRDWSLPEIVNFIVKADRWDGANYMWSIKDEIIDPYGVLKEMGPNLLSSSKRFWDRMLANVINANGLCYDGLSFFNTAHPVNKAKPELGTYSNDINADLDEAGIVSALDQLATMPDFNGNFMNTSLGTPLLVVSTKQQYLKAAKFINSGLIAKVVITNVAAASESTQLVGMAEIVHFQELNDAAVQNSNKRWYLIRNNGMPQAAFITRKMSSPALEYLGPNSVLAQLKMAQGLSVFAFGGIGYGLPQFIVRCTTP